MFHPEGPTLPELARQALSSTERGYDLLAPKFDRTPFRTPDWLLEAAAPYVGPPGSVGSALDLCCGTGATMRMLQALCRERVVGVDFSLGMLAEARRRLRSSPSPPGPLFLPGSPRPPFTPSRERGKQDSAASLCFIRADVLDLAFGATSAGRGASGSFDVVTCFGALGHFVRAQQPRLLTLVAHALRPGGRFIFPSAERPRPWSPRLWLALAFNATMAARNAVRRPPFVMYYLSFLLPQARRLLEDHGFEVEIHRGIDPERPRIDLVVARKLLKGRTAVRPRGARLCARGAPGCAPEGRPAVRPAYELSPIEMSSTSKISAAPPGMPGRP